MFLFKLLSLKQKCRQNYIFIKDLRYSVPDFHLTVYQKENKEPLKLVRLQPINNITLGKNML